MLCRDAGWRELDFLGMAPAATCGMGGSSPMVDRATGLWICLFAGRAAISLGSALPSGDGIGPIQRGKVAFEHDGLPPLMRGKLSRSPSDL
jgi:hypothetical protein